MPQYISPAHSTLATPKDGAMRGVLTRCTLRWLGAASLLGSVLCVHSAVGEQIPVHYVEGTEHGFLVLRSEEGKKLAVGDLLQVVHGDRVTSRVTFKFSDGSVDDETTVFSQRGHFRLLTDHHVQKGPFFPHPTDLDIDARSGQVRMRSTGKDGKQETEADHLELPPDLVNGLFLTLVKNISPTTPETTVPMLVASPKPRIVHLVFSPQGTEPLFIAGSKRSAMRFLVRVELGGLAGIVAPLVGKQPRNGQIWIMGGEAPAFVKAEYELYEGGPMSSLQLTSPVWPSTSLK